MFKIIYLLVLLILQFSCYANIVNQQLAQAVINKKNITNNKIDIIYDSNQVNSFIDKNAQYFKDLENLEISNDRFKVKLNFFYNDQLSSIVASGKLNILYKTPVAAYTLNKGDLINKNNIKFTYLPNSKLHSALSNEQQLIGKQARTKINKNSIFKKNYVIEPLLVTKNKLVTIIYQTKNLQLKAMGIAYENGQYGDIIRVINEKSGKKIYATIIGKNLVRINV